jgi:hypothetical protein
MADSNIARSRRWGSPPWSSMAMAWSVRTSSGARKRGTSVTWQAFASIPRVSRIPRARGGRGGRRPLPVSDVHEDKGYRLRATDSAAEPRSPVAVGNLESPETGLLPSQPFASLWARNRRQPSIAGARTKDGKHRLQTSIGTAYGSRYLRVSRALASASAWNVSVAGSKARVRPVA